MAASLRLAHLGPGTIQSAEGRTTTLSSASFPTKSFFVKGKNGARKKRKKPEQKTSNKTNWIVEAKCSNDPWQLGCSGADKKEKCPAKWPCNNEMRRHWLQ